MATTTDEAVAVEDIIKLMMVQNADALETFAGLLRKIESDFLTATGERTLDGEVEEVIRVVLQVCNDAIEKVLSLQEQLQTRFVESYFPAQD